MIVKKHLSQELDRYIERIKAGDNFTLLRYGDGERRLAEGKKIVAQEGWRAGMTQTPLGKAISASLKMRGDNVVFGISCPCCSVDDYIWYRKRLGNSNITFANLFVNCNYSSFLKSFLEINREAIVIANYRGRENTIGNLKILKYYSVDDDCVGFYSGKFDKLLKEIISDYGKRDNLLYVFSAGPLSEPLIMKLYEHNPNNCYIDFGSSLDLFVHGKDSRPYAKTGSMYAKRNCWMYDPSLDIRKFAGRLIWMRLVYKVRDNLYRIIHHLPGGFYYSHKH